MATENRTKIQDYGFRDQFFGIPLPEGLKVRELGISERLAENLSGGATSDYSDALATSPYMLPTGQMANMPEPNNQSSGSGPVYDPSQFELARKQNQVDKPTDKTKTGGGGGNTGGGDSKLEQLAKMDRNPVQEQEYQTLLEQMRQEAQRGSQDDLRLINEAANEQLGYLSEVENTLRAQLPNILAEARAQYESRLGQLGTSRQEAEAQTQEQRIQAGELQQRQSDELSASLNQGLQSARRGFGGAGSLSEAANTILNQEFMRMQGQNMQGARQTMREIARAERSIVEQYNNKRQELQLVRDQAINQANREFNNQLLEIKSRRADVASARSNASLQALQNLRDRVFSINAQQAQFMQALEAQRQQAQIQLDLYKQQAGMETAASGGAVNNYNTMLDQTGAGMPSTNANTAALGPDMGQYFGRISSNRDDEESIISNLFGIQPGMATQ